MNRIEWNRIEDIKQKKTRNENKQTNQKQRDLEKEHEIEIH